MARHEESTPSLTKHMINEDEISEECNVMISRKILKRPVVRSDYQQDADYHDRLINEEFKQKFAEKSVKTQ
ncbi:hypothetical protein PABG_12014 [Paracoccidioides brasiliensis Pb03]|nr:hypothetical protein PABG_12014 [Paracoccidioides brasiliensis Pb03]